MSKLYAGRDDVTAGASSLDWVFLCNGLPSVGFLGRLLMDGAIKHAIASLVNNFLVTSMLLHITEVSMISYINQEVMIVDSL
jgi:hypothetical protein